MTPLISFAQTATYDLSPPASRLPPFVWTAFTAINKLHGVWRWYRRAELYSNPDNFAQLLAGHAVNIIVGDTLILRIAAQCLLIATRILECVQQQAALINAGQSWLSAVKGHYAPKAKISWKELSPHPFLSPSTDYWLRSTGQSISYKVGRIARSTIILFVEAFTLSMKIMDAVDAFCLSPQTRNEGLNEGFINTIKWLDALTENKEELLNGLEDNRAIIEKIVSGSPLTYETIHSGVEKTLDRTEKIQKRAKQAASFSNGLLVEMGKKIASGGMVLAGLADYRPTFLAPKNIG